MRRANNPEIVFTEDKKIAGITLGFDFTAEHEWGIQALKQSFGITEDIAVYGVARRQITKIPTKYDRLLWAETKTEGGFVFAGSYFIEQVEKNPKNLFDFGELREYHAWNKKTKQKEQQLEYQLRTAWDEKSFACVSSNQEQIKALREIHQAILKFDVALGFFGRSGPFNKIGSGLGIAIISRMPQSIRNAWENADRERHLLAIKVDESGIEKLLQEKGKRWYALRPEFNKDGKLVFWLNPQEQQKYNCGWMTLDDLKDWADDKGKIIKSKEEVQR